MDTQLGLRIPQARVLRELVPTNLLSQSTEWPVMTTRTIAKKIGVSLVSDYIRRALRGLADGSKSGQPHLGLLALGLVEEITLDVDGLTEVNYRITTKGVQEYKRSVEGRKLPKVKTPDLCTNLRYIQEAE